MWISNLEKSRRVLAFDAEKLCVSERFSLIRRRKNNSVQLFPQLARTLARLTTYCAGLCFKSLASNFFFTGNKFLLSCQETRRLLQLLKKRAFVSLESSKHVGLVSYLIVCISSKPLLNSFLFDFVFTIHHKPAAISTLISRQQFRITHFHLTDELYPDTIKEL